jgi:sugar O-acyltransferase (sialic acid O-acetyltransferase NeuD family)
MKKKLVIIGTGNTAEQIMNAAINTGIYLPIGFAVNEKYHTVAEIYGLPVYVLEHIEESLNAADTEFFVAIQWNRLNADRRVVYESLKQKGYKFAKIIARSAILQDNVQIGENCWVSELAVIEANVIVGNNTFIKSNAVITHNVNIGKHCFIGAKSVIGGYTEIGENCFVGLGAIIHNNIKLGVSCLIPAGAIIKMNLNDYSLVTEKKVSVLELSKAKIERLLTVR